MQIEKIYNSKIRGTMNASSKYLLTCTVLTLLSTINGFNVIPESIDARSTIRKVNTKSAFSLYAPHPFLRRHGHLYEYIDPSNEIRNECNDNSNDISTADASITPPLSSSNIPGKGMNSNNRGGKITLVGSGPGDPDLLTVAAYRIISDPDAFIVSDRLVSPEILNLIQGEYKIARKLPGCAEKAQNEIYTWCEEALNEGKHVIRLKIGDPFVFGRGGEEVLKFRSMGYEPSIIPGVSAAFAAPLLGSIPVTHRGVSNQVVMCTGYGRNGTSPDLIQYHEEQTVVFLMAVGRLQELCNNLIKLAGYPSKTPVAIIEKAGCPEQRTLVGDMEDIADLASKYEIKPPSTIVVGKVVNVLLGEEGEDAAHGLIIDKCQEINAVISEN